MRGRGTAVACFYPCPLFPSDSFPLSPVFGGRGGRTTWFARCPEGVLLLLLVLLLVVFLILIFIIILLAARPTSAAAIGESKRKIRIKIGKRIKSKTRSKSRSPSGQRANHVVHPGGVGSEGFIPVPLPGSGGEGLLRQALSAAVRGRRGSRSCAARPICHCDPVPSRFVGCGWPPRRVRWAAS